MHEPPAVTSPTVHPETAVLPAVAANVNGSNPFSTSSRPNAAVPAFSRLSNSNSHRCPNGQSTPHSPSHSLEDAKSTNKNYAATTTTVPNEFNELYLVIVVAVMARVVAADGHLRLHHNPGPQLSSSLQSGHLLLLLMARTNERTNERTNG